MPVPRKQIFTEDEYLAMEAVSLQRQEFVNGEIFMMVGVRQSHSAIVFNLSQILGQRIVGRDCIAHMGEFRLEIHT